jgi:NADPH-dependent ferric siderophore reductase
MPWWRAFGADLLREAGEHLVATSALRAARRRADAPEFRAYPARVERVARLSPNFVRVTFKDAALAAFGYAGYDQRVKVLLPQRGRTFDDLPRGDEWYLRWRQLPDDIRPDVRTYTVRAYREAEGELDVDFVLHGHRHDKTDGPLSRWAATAQPGDHVAVLGPDRPGTGRMWGVEWSPPSTIRRVLLAGDETAVPAMAAILEALPAHLTGHVFAEVPEPEDVLGFEASDHVDVQWLVRRHSHAPSPRGALLEAAVRNALARLRGPTATESAWTEVEEDETALLWDVPDSDGDEPEDLYVWMAGEAATMRRLRRLARQEHALPKSTVACMGYWREGRSERV